jgi:hypothetical protein
LRHEGVSEGLENNQVARDGDPERADCDSPRRMRRNDRKAKRRQSRKRPARGEAHHHIRFVTPAPRAKSSEARFCSRSERVCATLLQRYIPRFRLEEGISFQVPIGTDRQGNTLAVDFLVDGVLVEYHPLRFQRDRRRCGDFTDSDDHALFRKILHVLSGARREFFCRAVNRQLADGYYARRRALLDLHPLFRRTELIVVTDPSELYRKVIARFGRGYPESEQVFVSDFLNLLSLPSS